MPKIACMFSWFFYQGIHHQLGPSLQKSLLRAWNGQLAWAIRRLVDDPVRRSGGRAGGRTAGGRVRSGLWGRRDGWTSPSIWARPGFRPSTTSTFHPSNALTARTRSLSTVLSALAWSPDRPPCIPACSIVCRSIPPAHLPARSPTRPPTDRSEWPPAHQSTHPARLDHFRPENDLCFLLFVSSIVAGRSAVQTRRLVKSPWYGPGLPARSSTPPVPEPPSLVRSRRRIGAPPSPLRRNAEEKGTAT